MRLVKQRIKIPSIPASIKGGDIGEFLRKIHDVLSKDLSERISATDLDLLENQTGSTLSRGDVVALGTSVDESVSLDDTQGSLSPFVVALTEPEVGKKGFFSTQGITPIAKTQGSFSRGEYLRKSATSKALEGTGTIIGSATSIPTEALAVALAPSGGGSALLPVYLLGFTSSGSGIEDQSVTADKVGTDWPHARVFRSTNQSISTGTRTPINFDTERWDTGDLWSAGNSERFVISRAGLYIMGACVEWEDNNTGIRNLEINVGPPGAGNKSLIAVVTDDPASSGFRQVINSQWRLDAGDEVEITVFQDSGFSLNIEKSTNPFSPEAWIAWLRP